MECLVFDIWGDFAHFRSIETTSSPLSYPFIPKPSVIGMLSAMIGFDKDEKADNYYLQEFTQRNFWLAVRIKQPIKKIRIMENYVDVKSWEPKARIKYMLGTNKLTRDYLISHTQIRVEFLQDPCFRIFVYHEDPQIMKDLESALSNHAPYYTVSLGLAQNLANYQWVGKYPFVQNAEPSDPISLSSVLRKDKLVDGKLKLEEGIVLKTCNLPVDMEPDRSVSYSE